MYLRRMWFVLAVASLSCFAEAPRQAMGFGDVSLTGVIGRRLSKMVRNHVEAHDPMYLASCFSDRSEDSLWQTEFWGKYMHGACPLMQSAGSDAEGMKVRCAG